MRQVLTAALAELALVGLAAVGFAAACANPGAPPGGPPDAAPPKLLKVSPDTGVTNAHPRVMVLQFDEVLNERSTPTGGAGGAGGGGTSFGGGSSSGASATIGDLFVISPRVGEVEVDWHRSRLELRPRKGWRSNTTYVVQMLPGLSDLRNNRDTVGRTFVFSTGPEIATGRIGGIAFDWVAAKPAPSAWIEARPVDDTTLAYVAVADSIGRFTVTHVPPGRYQLRAILDQNRNRSLDPREMFDSATITLRDSTSREMLAFVHDTIGAGIAQVEIRDTLTLRVQFDRAVDTAQRVTPATFTLKSNDSALVAIARVWPLAAFDSIRQDSVKRKAASDSVERARVADSTRRADSAKAVAEGKPIPQRPAARPPAIAPADTAKKPPPPPKPSVPSPAIEFVLRLAAPLAPGSAYRLRADSVRNLLGRPRSSERVFTTPKTPPPDSTKARRDTTGTRVDTSAVRRDTTAARRDTSAVRRDSSRTPPDTSRRPRAL